MKKNFNEAANKGGVYRIRNKINRNSYIGSTNRFKTRCYEHERSLRSHKHHSKKLQRAWDKYGEGVFIFEVLEIVEDVSVEKRRTIEQTYLDEIKDWRRCYNIKKKAIQKQGPWSSTPEETKKKKANILKERWENDQKFRERMSGENHPFFGKPCSEERKKIISEKAKGNTRFKDHHHTPEAKKKISEAQKGVPNSREQNENHSKMLKGRKPTKETIEKRANSARGFKQTEKQKKACAQANSKFYDVKLISPDKEIFGPLFNIMEFCRQHNLVAQKIYQIINGKRKSHRGWKLSS